MKQILRLLILAVALLGSTRPVVAETFTPFQAGKVPDTVVKLWGDLDLRSEPLDLEIVNQWKEDGAVCWLVKFTVCTVKGTPSRIAAFYTFPESASATRKVPAFVWAHGGGQRAERRRGAYFAKHGYATIDINWGGREMVEGIKQNTDWGKVDPSQGPKFYPGALRPQVKLDLQPDEHTIDSVPSGRNGNWFLLTYAARRALTFLEQRPEVDADKLGMTGYSMGGNITSYASIDPRLKAVAPMVGGTGFLTVDLPGLPGSATRGHFKSADLWATTVDSDAFWPHTKCPVLWLTATNDFHGTVDRAYLCNDLLADGVESRLSFLPHFNHALGPEQWVLINLWFDHYLKGSGAPIPATPPSTMKIASDGTATFTVTPANHSELDSVEVFYSHDPEAISRFWKTAPSKERTGTWTAQIPTLPNQLLYAFAHCRYRLPGGKTLDVLEGADTSTYALASELQSHLPDKIDIDSLRVAAPSEAVFHDFQAEGLNSWGGPIHRGGMRTYKPRDPARATPSPDSALIVHLGNVDQAFSLRFRVSKNDHLRNRKRSETFTWNLHVTPEHSGQKVEIRSTDFKLQGGDKVMANWEEVAHLTMHSLRVENGQHVDTTREHAGPTIQKLTWKAP